MPRSFTYALYRLNAIIRDLGTDGAGDSLITLRQRTAGTIDPVTGLLSGESDTDYVVPGLISIFQDEFETKSDVESTIYEALISNQNLGTTPHLGDTVISADGTSYIVRKVEPSYLGTVISAWLLYLEA